MVPSPTLYRLAANREYDSIPERVASHPEDVIWTDRYGSTCLHILCQARTHVDTTLLQAVKAIVHYRPDVVAWANVATWTPLHFAVECHGVEQRFTSHSSSFAPQSSSASSSASSSRNHSRSSSPSVESPYPLSKHFLEVCLSVSNEEFETEESSCRNSNNRHLFSRKPMARHHHIHVMQHSTLLVLLLMEACPHAVSVPTKTGSKTKTPFHLACEADADYRILRQMLHINPHLALQSFVQSSYVPYAAPAENPLQLLWKNHHYHHHRSHKRSHRHHHPAHDALMDKMALLLRAAHTGTVDSHHSPANSNSFRLLNAVCSVQCPRDYAISILKEREAELGEPDEHGLLPLHYAVRSATMDHPAYAHFLLTDSPLLQACPQAASVVDEHGRLPLHTALRQGLTWHKGGVQELTLLNTNVLHTVDPDTGLVPFLTSARRAMHSRLHLSTTLELLLAAPELVQPWRWRRNQPTTRPDTTRENDTAAASGYG